MRCLRPHRGQKCRRGKNIGVTLLPAEGSHRAGWLPQPALLLEVAGQQPGATPHLQFERLLKRTAPPMKFTTLIPVMAVLWLLGVSVPSPSGGTVAADGLFLGDKHKNRGMDCSGCHKESPPKQDVPMAVCLGCHGDYGKVAAKTNEIDPNPHDSHLGGIDCGKCHHAHKPSVNVCNECHEMDMKVP
jgi:hypothetical protein